MTLSVTSGRNGGTASWRLCAELRAAPRHHHRRRAPATPTAGQSARGCSYEAWSLIITTNLEFSQWGSVLTDEQTTAAIIDRMAPHGHLIVFDGESYRMKHALMKER